MCAGEQNQLFLRKYKGSGLGGQFSSGNTKDSMSVTRSSLQNIWFEHTEPQITYPTAGPHWGMRYPTAGPLWGA